jgi:hypothetical protein
LCSNLKTIKNLYKGPFNIYVDKMRGGGYGVKNVFFCPHSGYKNCPRRGTVLHFGVKVAVVRYLNFSKIANNGFNMQFNFILNVDKLLHISVQFYTKPMTTSLSNCLN